MSINPNRHTAAVTRAKVRTIAPKKSSGLEGIHFARLEESLRSTKRDAGNERTSTRKGGGVDPVREKSERHSAVFVMGNGLRCVDGS